MPAVTSMKLLPEAVSLLLHMERGRYVVLCDDLSLIVTDDLMDGDAVVFDRHDDA